MPIASLPQSALTSLEPTAVLFDLDGTISDSGAAITSAVAEALAAGDYPAISQADLLHFVGPPIRDGFREFGGVAEEDLDRVVAAFRPLYEGRMLAPAFEGMPELVRALHSRGVPLALATSKRRALAMQIVEHSGLTEYFTAQCGASDDGTRAWKADIVEDTLAALRAEGVDVSRAVMVGDRDHDVNGAITHDILSVFVAWGYGTDEERDGASAVATDVGELAQLLGVS
ncbi:HAD hydrolase-like protein [Pseudactinotalea sp. HY158]|uniref:HAD hydrolase-like protein n=1 Tax=Pseudactinotalea sp. HY158 TaxID=2654547 RepID=UPI001891FF92|nr:HAD hydrolase-like protein [Pseudactinotalea sp. HY158]